MLVKMAEAIGRVVLAGRELTRLAGLVQRNVCCVFGYASAGSMRCCIGLLVIFCLACFLLGVGSRWRNGVKL